LPPPGTPLPGPAKSLWSSSTLNIGGTLKRKPVPPPQLPPRKSTLDGSGNMPQPANQERKKTPPPLPSRKATTAGRHRESGSRVETDEGSRSSEATMEENLVVVAAPSEEDLPIATSGAEQQDDLAASEGHATPDLDNVLQQATDDTDGPDDARLVREEPMEGHADEAHDDQEDVAAVESGAD